MTCCPFLPQPTSTPTQDYQVRLQVQGKKLSVGAAGDSIVLVDTSPIKANAAIGALNTLEGRLPRRDRKLTNQAFGRAKKWIKNAAAAGGTSPASRSFSNFGVKGSDARVDIEVIRGDVNLVP